MVISVEQLVVGFPIEVFLCFHAFFFLPLLRLPLILRVGVSAYFDCQHTVS
jgi:hypothetical protein